MIWNDKINNLLDRLHDAEILKEKGFGYEAPFSPSILLEGLHNQAEIETALLYEITSKCFFELEPFEEKYGKERIECVKLLQALDSYGKDYHANLVKVKNDSVARNVRLQIIKLRHDRETFYKGGRGKDTYSEQYYLDLRETEYLKPMVFTAILRTCREFLYDRIAVTVYDIKRENVIIEKSTSNQNSVMKWTVSEETITAIKEMPIDFARIWCYRWNYPITNQAVGTHNDSFILSSNSAKEAGTVTNAKTTEIVFENGKALHDVPDDVSNYVYELAKNVFSILRKGGVDLYELDREGELY